MSRPRFQRSALGLILVGLTSAGTGLRAQVNPPSKPGFPLTLAGRGPGIFSQPVVADLGLSADGTKSLIFVTMPDWTAAGNCGTQGELHVIHKNSGGTWGQAPGFPIALGIPSQSSPAVGDLDGDGRNDIVLGLGVNCSLSLPGSGVTAFRNMGLAPWTQLWHVVTKDYIGAPGGPDGQPDPVASTPAIGDVDGDGRPEVAFGSFDQWLYLVNGENGLPNGAQWPIFIRDTVWSSPALFDVDGDGRRDVVIGVDAHLHGPPHNTPDGGCLHVLRFDATQPQTPPETPDFWGPPTEPPGFPRCVDQVIFSSVAVGDITGDGRPEIVHGTGTYYTSPPRTPLVHAWTLQGQQVPGWPVTVAAPVSTAPALADLDGDGDLEVIVTTTDVGGNDHRLQAFRGNGSQVFNSAVKDCNNVSFSAGNPVVGDMFGANAGLEILVPTNTSVAVFSSTGALLSTSSGCLGTNTFYTETGLHAAAVADFENPAAAGAKIEAVAVSAAPFPSAADTKVYVWNPIDRSSVPPWGFFRNDDQRRGVSPQPCAPLYPDTLFLHTLAPCRLVDTRDAAGPYGGPSLASGAIRNFTVVGAGIGPGGCTIPATAKALSLNVTVQASTGQGSASLAPKCLLAPDFGLIHFNSGQTRANNAVLALGPGGVITARSLVAGAGNVQLVIDVNGYFE